ncbi:MAG: DUF547 domain-containing protein [Gammaproteobacteria bacterium]|nr:DUF547 domain-containing protein [Gammaproteobacteria bacterium]
MARLLVLLVVLASGPVAFGAIPAADDLDEVLLRNVRDGFVDYDGIRADPAFGRYVAGLATADEADLGTPATRVAFFINAYNALAIQGILDGRSPRSWLGRRGYFRGKDHQVLGASTSLDQLEADRLLPLGEPRALFAVACGALACPRLANRAYDAGTLEPRLEQAARAFANDPTRNRYDPVRRIAFLSSLFEAHQAEFARAAGSYQKYLARYVADPAAAELLARDGFEVRFVPDEWTLNGTFRGARR